MSQLILNWLNDEVGLSRPIESLENDFKDGYLLGELMNIFNQQDDFDKFLTKGNPDAKINNFCLLEITMKRLGVTFNSKIAYDIMQGNIGVILKLLYEIKTSVELIAKTSRPLLKKAKDGELVEKLTRVVHATKPIYDKTMSLTFENSVRNFIENPSNLLLDESLKRFKDHELEFYKTVANRENSSISDFQNELQRRKTIDKQRKKQEKEFMNTWNKMNEDQWKINQLVARERKFIKQKVIDFSTSKRETAISNHKKEARESVLKGIDEFEDKLRNEIFPDDPEMESTVGKAVKEFGGDETTDVLQLKTLNQKYLDEGLSYAQKKLKEHHQHLLETQKVHNRRRLKYFTDREFQHVRDIRMQAELDIVSQLLNISHPEEISNHSKKSILTHIPIFKQNISNRNDMIGELNSKKDELKIKLNNEKVSREINFVINPRENAQNELFSICQTAETSANRQINLEMVAEIIDKVIDLTSWTCWIREFSDLYDKKDDNNDFILPEKIWFDGIKCFTSDLAFPASIPDYIQLNSSSDYPDCYVTKFNFCDPDWELDHVFTSKDIVSFSADDSSRIEMLAEAEKESYISSVAEIVSLEGCEASSEIDLSSHMNIPDVGFPPNWLVNTQPNYLLGEAIVAIRSTLDPIPEDPKPPIDFPQEKLRLCLCGNSNTARERIANRLKNDYSLEVICVEVLLKSAIEFSINAHSNPSDTERDYYGNICFNIHSAMSNGQAATDQDYVDLIVIRIQELINNESYNGFVIKDFPETENQANLLFLALSGINFQNKKPHPTDKLSKIALPFPCVPPEYDPKNCCIDGVIYIETSPNQIISQRIRERMDLVEQKVVYLDDNSSCKDVSTLYESYSPLLPFQVVGASVKYTEDNNLSLKQFLSKLSLLREFNLTNFLDGFKTKFISFTVPRLLIFFFNLLFLYLLNKIEEKLSTEISTFVSEYYPFVSNKAEDSIEDNNTNQDDKTLSANPDCQEPLNQEELTQQVSTEEIVPEPTDSSVNKEEQSNSENIASDSLPEEPPKVYDALNQIPLKLAESLNRIWTTCEESSYKVTKDVFTALRDVRYQMFQRYRNSCDSIQGMYITKDTKQKIFTEFCHSFNSIPFDLRFDPDLICELHLRALELRSSLSSITDSRKKESTKILDGITSDGIIGIFNHRVKSELSRIIQSELNRFIASCHVLFDTSKILNKFKKTALFSNELEEALESGSASEESSKGKDSKGKDSKGKAAAPPGKGKAGNDAVITPYRSPVAPLIVNELSLKAVPSSSASSNNNPSSSSDKAKDPKAKKNEAEPSVKDPFLEAENSALEYLQTFSKDSFTINRSLYVFHEAGDPVVESICSSVERAIWLEANRCRRTIEYFKDIMNQQISWLNSFEEFVKTNLSRKIQNQWMREASTDERMVTLVNECIENSVPILHSWKISSDAISIEKNTLTETNIPETFIL